MKTWTRLLSLLLCAALAFSLCVVGVSADTTTISISDAAGLAKIGVDPAYPMNGKYQLTADITLSGSWTPIGKGYFHAGTLTPVAFTGTFDGNGKTISGLKVVPSAEDDTAGNAATTANQKVDGTNEYSHNANTTVLAQGLFSYVSGATIKNLKIASPDVTGWNYAGALAGIAENSTITGITVTNPKIFCNWENAGGVLGTVRDTADGTSTVSGCTVSDGTVSTPQQEENQNGAGGLIGRIQNGTNTISGNTVSGTSVTAYRKVAGLVGYVLQPTLLTMSGNVVSNVALSISNAAKNKLDTPYYGILFGEVQDSPNTNRAYETYTDNDYATGWSGTSQDSKIAITGGKTTLANNTASGATVSMAQGVNEYVASVGDNSYGYINSAIQAADSGDTVKVLKDFTTAKAIYVNKPLTLDLNGKTITSSASQVIRADAALTINATNGGTVNATASSYPFILVETAGITINGGTFTATNSAYALFIGNGTTATVNDGTFDGWIYSNGTYTGVNVTFNGGTFNKMLYLAAKDISVTYNGGTFNAGTEFKGSTVTVNDGTFKGNGNTPTHNASGNGSSTNGAWALAVVDNKGYGAANVTINGGKFTGMVEKLDDDSDATNNNDTLTVSGGYFTSDPSAYVAPACIAAASDRTGYNYMVTTKTNAAVEVAAAAPVVAGPASPTTEETEAVNTLKAGTPAASGLEGAAGSVAQNTKTTEDEGKTALTNNKKTVNPGDTVTIYVQPYLDIVVTDADAATLTVNITPMVKTVASTATTAGGITDTNSAQIDQAEKLTVTTPVTIKLPIPESLAAKVTPATTPATYKPLTIKHVKENGDIYYYTAAVTAESGQYYATFTVTHGFSQFTLQAQDTRKLTVNYDSGAASAKYSATDAGASLPTAAKSGYAFSGWTFAGATGTYTELTGALWDALMTGKTGDQTVAAAAQFTAIPVSANCTLTFEVNGGSAVEAVTKASGTVVSLSAYKPTRAGFAFAGWFSDAALTVRVVSVTLTGDVTLYARWVAGDGGFPFTDVPEASFCRDAVAWAYHTGVTEGKTAVLFDPDGKCSRAEAATFLWRAMGSPAPEYSICPFTDVKADAYYYKAVLWAAGKGIIDGMTATAFVPDDTVTRGQMVMLLWRTAGKPQAGTANPFSDVTAGDYFCSAVLWAVSEKLTDGTTDTTFSPADFCTRGQLVTFLWRYLGK